MRRSTYSDIEAGLWRVLAASPEFVGLGCSEFRTYDGNIFPTPTAANPITAESLPAAIGDLGPIRTQRQPRAWRDVIAWSLRGLFAATDRADAEEFVSVVTAVLGSHRTWQADRELAGLVQTLDIVGATIAPISGPSEAGSFLWQAIVETSITTAPLRDG